MHKSRAYIQYRKIVDVDMKKIVNRYFFRITFSNMQKIKLNLCKQIRSIKIGTQ